MASIGGNDIFVDIGDKGWGVLACQRYLGGIGGSKTLHVGDQFLSAGANDFKVSHNFVAMDDEVSEYDRRGWLARLRGSLVQLKRSSCWTNWPSTAYHSPNHRTAYRKE